jgi:tRNA A-37 threonylcarbamoyl transferase component Bud32
MTCTEKVSREAALRWLDEHESWFQAGQAGAALPFPGAPAAAPRIAVVPAESGELVAKRERPSLLRSVRYALSGRQARARRAFRLALALRRAGVRTPEPLAIIEHRERGLVRRSCLVLESLDALPLGDFLAARLPLLEAGTSEQLRERLWEAVAAEVARLHAARFRQRDLKAANILVAEDAQGRFQVSLIDLDGVTRLRAPPARRVRLRDLARLQVSLRAPKLATAGVTDGDWTRLLSLYLEKAAGKGPAADEVQGAARETRRWAMRKEARNRRRRRPIS